MIQKIHHFHNLYVTRYVNRLKISITLGRAPIETKW